MNTIYYRPLNVNQAVAYTATAASSSAVGNQTYAVRVHASTACYVNWGGTASATAGCYIEANEPYTFTINPGEVVSAVSVASSGTLYLSELTR